MSESARAQAENAQSKVLAGKRIVLTGATRGLGRAAALLLAAEGASLIVNGRDREQLDALVDEIRAADGQARAVVGSVGDEGVAAAVVAACVEEYGGIDCLINNAGIVRDRTTMKLSAEDFDAVIETNLRGTFLCGREAARAMKETGGEIVNVVSNVAFHGSVGQANYAASKAGGAALMRAWVTEFSRYGIRVNSIWPLAVTDMTQVVIDNMGNAAREKGEEPPSGAAIGLGDPAEVAKILVYLASDLAADVNNQIISFNGGRLATWTHPVEVDVQTRPSWSIEDLGAALGPGGTVGRQEMYELKLDPLPEAAAG